MALISGDISTAATHLKNNDLVAIPTETVYGLAGNALDGNAVAKIFETKNRPSFDPLIVHIAKLKDAYEFVNEFPAPLKRLAEKFWPGPLTLLLPRKNIIPDLVTSGLPRVALRVPSHPLTLGLLKALNFPLAAPSANPFGYISPTTAQHVEQQLGEKIPFILDGGACKVGLESTIVGMEEGQVTIYRLGGLAVDQIEEQVGKVHVKDHSSSNPQAPGLLDSHYAPKTPFRLGQLSTLIDSVKKEGLSFAVLSLSSRFDQVATDLQIQLSAKKDLNEAAQNLFAAMRDLDRKGVDIILAEKMPDTGLGLAMNDRLQRAATKG